MSRIGIRRLRLVGAAMDYDVSFIANEKIRSISVIAGEISTGKTSVLEFIDFCLGASRHPRHQEIQRQVRSALLEVELDSQTFVIERPLFSTEKIAFVHYGTIEQLAIPHPTLRKIIEPAGSHESLSMFLLEHCGLAGVSLKEAPTKPDSDSDPLSFRDLMWLSFLPNQRMDNKELLHERHFMEQIKLRQVVEVIFGVHDDQLAKLSEALHKAEDDKTKLLSDIHSLEHFLLEQNVPEQLELGKLLIDLKDREQEAEHRLAEITQTMRARTDFAQDIRREYGEQSFAAKKAAAVVRDRETLLRRLLPLRSQYAEDEAKLFFYEEAHTLFDPLRVTVCPSCLSKVQPPTINAGECSLCGQAVVPSSEVVDVGSELRSVRTRKREIDRYVEEIEKEITEARVLYIDASRSEAEAQRQLDNQVAETLSPYVAERDQLVRKLGDILAKRENIQRQMSWHVGLERRQVEFARLEGQAKSLRDEIRSRDHDRPSREEVVSDLSERFRSILVDFGFPKLDDPTRPYVDARFVPYVRGNVYREIGSTGALTLISLAWYLAIFERALEHGEPHPGFLMIDSPQKNLKPQAGGKPTEFQNPEIVGRVWDRLLRTAEVCGPNAQLIVVDNRPPDQTRPVVVIEYSGHVGKPPYGLIINEIH